MPGQCAGSAADTSMALHKGSMRQFWACGNLDMPNATPPAGSKRCTTAAMACCGGSRKLMVANYWKSNYS